MENNQHYEPTIKKTYEKQEDYIFKQLEDCQTNELWYEIDNDNAKYLYNYIKNLQSKKQQIISWLEDKIKDITDYAVSFGLFIDKDISHEIDIKKQIYQEALNFVNKGGKE